jgi:ATP-dependent DNA helicase RecG
LSPWINRLLSWGLVQSTGKTQATRYFVDPDLLRRLEFPASTTLRRIEPHRLQALVVEDLSRYPRSAGGEINKRIGIEIPYKQVKRAIDVLIGAGQVLFDGDKRGRRYWLTE